MNGLKPPLQAFVAGMNPMDFTSAYEHAKTAKVVNKLQQEPEKESVELTEEIKQRIGQLKELVKEMSDIESNLHEQSRQNDSQQTGKRRRKVEKYGRRKADSKAIRSNRRQDRQETTESREIRRADMEILGETFLERFDKCGPTWLYDKMLFKLKQQSNQTVDQYASLLQLKAEKARKTDKEILSYFMNGLKPPLQAFVAGMNPMDFTSAYEHAKTAKVVNKLQQEPEEESAELTEEIKERIGQLKELVKEMSDIESNLHEQSRQNDSQQTGKRRRKVQKYGRRKADSKAIRSNRRQDRQETTESREIRRADMEILGETFLERFDKCGPTWLYDKMLFELKQQSNQTVDQYASLLQLKAEKARKTDKEILSYFMNGLKPPLQAFVAGMNPMDFTSAYEHAKTAKVVNKLQQEPRRSQSRVNGGDQTKNRTIERTCERNVGH
ncbi:uncharacterized protein PF3D7_1120000-like [Ptychodera flava]|uniref:uncharacterized protein PF3D7_1120000-like n=1 Tax=Ptychodera flava TaxID=63121 RepID=UPI00396A6AE3